MSKPHRIRPSIAAVLALSAAVVAWAPAARADTAADRRLLAQSIRQRWTYRDGLPQNVVHRLLVARTGYLWIGSQEGLVRFDGVRFQVFTALETPGLAGNEVNALVEDERGVLWIGTSDGLSRLVGDRFERVEVGPGASVNELVSDGEGGVWAGTEAGALLHVVAGASLAIERIAGIAETRLLALARVGSEVWAGGYRGLTRVAYGRAVREPAFQEPVTRLLPGRDGTVWVGTARGLWRRPPGAATFERTPFAAGGTVAALLEDHEGALWVGVEGGPLVRVRDGREEQVAGVTVPSDVHALVEDGDGDLWAGTESVGLYRLRWGDVVTLARDEGLSADVVWAVHGGRGGVTWVATAAGLDRVTGDRPSPAHVAQLGGKDLAGLLEDRRGDLWVGTADALLRFRARSGMDRYAAESGLGGFMPRALYEDTRGELWVGTSHGLFRKEGDGFVPVPTDPGLPGDKINVLAEGRDGTIWAGATTGLARVEGGRLVPAHAGGGPIRGDVTALLPRADGTLWIGRVGQGLARLAGDRLQGWTQRDGLHEDTVVGLLEDQEGRLWLAGTRGIARVTPTELVEEAEGRRSSVTPVVFGTTDGMRERECNGGVSPSAWRGEDGRLWFATVRGVAVIDPAHLSPPAPPPPVRLEELVADGHAWPAESATRFAPGLRRLDVRYTGLSLAAAGRLRFRHRLMGLDETWLDAGGERVAHYTSLGPGRYVFEVQAANGAGPWGPAASLAFEVEPHVWQTRWFAGAVLLACVALIAGGPVLRIRSLRRREALLAARVEEEMRKVKVLRGLLPSCAWCNKVRDDGGAWLRFDQYVTRHTEARVTHGMCPECFAKHGSEAEEG